MWVAPRAASIVYFQSSMNKVTKGMVSAGITVRKASPNEGDGAVIQGLLNKVYIEENGYPGDPDGWESTSLYYIVRSGERPVGCIRIVDPEVDCKSSLPNECLREGGFIFPMEKMYGLGGVLEDRSRYVEPGRTVLVSEMRNTGTFLALTATAYLYVLRHHKAGAVCAASPGVVGPYLKMGWRLLEEKDLWSEDYGVYYAPMIAAPREIKPVYQEMFLEMEEHGIVCI